MRMRPATLLVLLLAIAPCAHALSWSEILFDPQGSDNGREYIELTGPEDLAGCMVRDSASADTLTLLRAGSNGVSLIVEDEGAYSNMSGPSLYGAGKAIGNGLGNAFEDLTIACNGTALLRTSYNASLVPGFKEGLSIVFADGAWVAGPIGGTPGAASASQPTAPQENGTQGSVPQATDAAVKGSGICNATLAIALSAQRGAPGDTIGFMIASGGYASFAADADGETLLEGDTLTRREYAITLPNASQVRIVAQARECDAHERATRVIAIVPRNGTAPVPAPAAAQADATRALAAPAPVPEGNETRAIPAARDGPEENGSAPAPAAVLADRDSGVVPWVSAFGIVTLVVSAGLFLRLRGEKEEA